MDAGVNGRAVIVGAGQAGTTAATALRERGWTGPIDLVAAENGDPYQRPPLSKGFLSGREGLEDLTVRAANTFARDGITWHPNDRAVRIDRGSQTVELESGTVVPYDVAVVATGARARRPEVSGAEVAGVLTLRSHGDSTELKRALRVSSTVVVIGGGFLGLEVAATAASAGTPVVVLERSPQILHRAVGTTVAEHLRAEHAAHGVDIRHGAAVASILHTRGVLHGVRLVDGEDVPADVVVTAIGAQPHDEIARQAGLPVDDGILVDGMLRTADPRIYAIGDCARFSHPHSGRLSRVESVQNATDQARHVAAQLTGENPPPYANVPWFWSHQYGRTLQIVGLSEPDDKDVRLVASKEEAVAVARVRDGIVTAVETINDPRTHMRARRILADGPLPLSEMDGVEVAALLAGHRSSVAQQW